MTGAEILLGVTRLLTPLLAAPIGSTLHSRFHKPLYDYYPDREQVYDYFIKSWSSLNNNVFRLSMIRTLAHDDHDRRTASKELELATRAFQDINSRLIAC
ncbi:hypothetical protein P167DRAFT_470620, partial [Morchella conica CCBAS932]